ncbi:MAG TPA: hypothetical protein VNN80_28250, partial [Polyangiaceae bacterium]|nr:hypothetical protein [Polyangiaceae bacterium]
MRGSENHCEAVAPKALGALAALVLSSGCGFDDGRTLVSSGDTVAEGAAPAGGAAGGAGNGGVVPLQNGPNGAAAELGCSSSLGDCSACEAGTTRCSASGAVERCDEATGAWVFSEACSGATPECVPETGTCGSCSAGDERTCVGALGNCAAGTQRCGADLRWGPCSIQAGIDSCVPGDDADCDGTPNNPPEGCSCSADVSCGVSDLGNCQLGTSRCVGGRLGACTGAVPPAARDCRSSADNDCDGFPDSALDTVCQCVPGAVEACDVHAGLDGIGVCRAGTRTCIVSAGALSSAWGACLGSVAPAASNCASAADNDCNGVLDREEAACAPPGVTVSLESRGNATFGFVRSSPPGLECSAPPCSASFPVGTQVTLESQTVTQFRHGFSGWGGPCSGLEECTFVASANVTVTAAFDPANIAFVTSATTTGDLGGRQGGDALCNQLAAAAGQPGSYVAWLSTSTESAVDRMRGSRGWIRPDGLPVVDTLDDFQGDMFYPIRVDQLGRDVGTLSVLTASTGAGRLGPPGGVPCGDFTSGLAGGSVVDGGNTNAIGFRFSSFNQAACNVPRPIYCFGLDREVAIRPRPDDGRVAFVSRGFLPSGGRAGADQFCQSEASQLGLSGSFRALLATSTASPASQFDLTGPPWIGLDGVRIASTARAFFESTQWDTAPKPNGAQGNGGVWVGGTSLTQPGTLQDTCNDWTSTGGNADVGSVGMVNVQDFFHFFATT